MSRTLLCFALLLCAVFASGQGVSTAVLNGDVTDPQGAVVVNAEVSATRTATSVTRTTYTTRAGLFVLNGLEPGEYDVQVTAKGFAAAKAKVRLEVGHQAELKLQLSLREQQTVISVDDTEALPIVDTVTSDVDGIVSARQIESLPLNGRNFLELAFLVPGNAPAPNFDPTKTTTVLVSSAGQLGRGGSVTIDGADNNDDVVGGSLHNVPQDAVQEFQIATNRYSAELGRSASSVVNVVTKSGTNDYHGSVSFFERDAALQGLPATFDRDLEAPPFDRQQYAGTLGGPLVKDKAWWFAGLEYRDQTGAVLAGERRPDPTGGGEIVNTLATAPLTDLLLTARGDWRVSDADTMMFRYSLDRSEETGASTLIRSIGSASERQTSQNH